MVTMRIENPRMRQVHGIIISWYLNVLCVCWWCFMFKVSKHDSNQIAHIEGALCSCVMDERERERLCSYPSVTVNTALPVEGQCSNNRWTCSIQWMLSFGAEQMGVFHKWGYPKMEGLCWNGCFGPPISSFTQCLGCSKIWGYASDMPRDSRRNAAISVGRMAGVCYEKEGPIYLSPSPSCALFVDMLSILSLCVVYNYPHYWIQIRSHSLTMFLDAPFAQSELALDGLRYATWGFQVKKPTPLSFSCWIAMICIQIIGSPKMSHLGFLCCSP